LICLSCAEYEHLQYSDTIKFTSFFPEVTFESAQFRGSSKRTCMKNWKDTSYDRSIPVRGSGRHYYVTQSPSTKPLMTMLRSLTAAAVLVLVYLCHVTADDAPARSRPPGMMFYLFLRNIRMSGHASQTQCMVYAHLRAQWPGKGSTLHLSPIRITTTSLHYRYLRNIRRYLYRRRDMGPNPNPGRPCSRLSSATWLDSCNIRNTSRISKLSCLIILQVYACIIIRVFTHYRQHGPC